MIVAVILAAGSGTRFGAGARPKQFAEIAGRPLFVHALASYRSADPAIRRVLVAHQDFLAESRAAVAAAGLADGTWVVAGGATRRASIQRGLAAVEREFAPRDEDIVILHNGASPNTPPATIRACIGALGHAAVAQACVPELRTQFERADDRAVAMLPRERIATSVDPTAFRAGALRAVLARQAEAGRARDTTTDIALELGYAVHLVPCDYGNIKVTSRWDLAAVRAAMQDRDAAP